MTQLGQGKSPYVKGQKAPYIYKFKTCKHTESVRQSASGVNRAGASWTWRGFAYKSCGVITGFEGRAA